MIYFKIKSILFHKGKLHFYVNIYVKRAQIGERMRERFSTEIDIQGGYYL